MDQPRSFGPWLRRQRMALDLTREELARKVGYSAATIRKIEAEERRPSAQVIERLVELFNISPQEQEAFLEFARGNWQSAFTSVSDDAPWRRSTLLLRPILPSPTTSLIGREGDIALVLSYLFDDNIRLVTLIGPPGIGKTRLSLEVAREVIPEFNDGVFFIDLASLIDPNLVASTIVQALGIEHPQSQAPLDRLIDGIGGKQMLLVLDNLEHLIETAARLVSGLLSACPQLKILTTSREALRVQGEWSYPVPSLNIPTTTQLRALKPEGVSNFSALNLFTERARALRPGFSFDADDLQAVAAICIQLDGLPLAIELIAARIRLMSPQSLLSRLKDGFSLHADGFRALPARQKSLFNAITWSYDLLSEVEKQVLARLSVFAGGFTFDSAEQVLWGASSQHSVNDLILSLLDKSLLQGTYESQSEPRFNMLVTIQQFALQRLRDCGQEADTRDRHLAYFLGMVKQANPELHGPDQVTWLERLEKEYGNFQAALTWCMTKADTQAALHLLGVLAWPWSLRGRSDGVRWWFDKISTLPEISTYPDLYARLLNHLGRQSWLMGDFSQARSVLDESLAIWLKLDVEGELGLAEALIFKGLVAQSGDGNYDTAQSCYERSLELCQNWKDLRGQAMAMFNLGRVADFRHQEAMAFSWFERSLDLFNQVGELWGVGRTSQLIGQLALKQGNLDKARQFFEQHLGIDERLHFRQGTAIALGNLGELYRYQADYDRAEQFYQSSLVMCREYNLKWDLSITLFFMGLLALHRNNYSLARQQFSDYFNLARTVHEGKIITSDLLISMAAVAAGIHQSERAARLYGAAQALFDSIDYEIPPFDRAEFERHIHQARQQLGDAAFEALVNEGRRMLLEQAVADALEIQTL